MAAIDIPVTITTDVQGHTAGTKTTEFYITLVAKLGGLLLGTGWVTGHDTVIQLGGVLLALVAQLAYVYSRTKLKLAVLAPAAKIDAIAQDLGAAGGTLDEIAAVKKLIAPDSAPAPKA